MGFLLLQTQGSHLLLSLEQELVLDQKTDKVMKAQNMNKKNLCWNKVIVN